MTDQAYDQAVEIMAETTWEAIWGDDPHPDSDLYKSARFRDHHIKPARIALDKLIEARVDRECPTCGGRGTSFYEWRAEPEDGPIPCPGHDCVKGRVLRGPLIILGPQQRTRLETALRDISSEAERVGVVDSTKVYRMDAAARTALRSMYGRPEEPEEMK